MVEHDAEFGVKSTREYNGLIFRTTQVKCGVRYIRFSLGSFTVHLDNWVHTTGLHVQWCLSDSILGHLAIHTRYTVFASVLMSLPIFF